MKTNMINTNSVIKSICAVVMLLGMSVSAWGAKTGTIEFGNEPKVKINSASVTGDDSQGNTWTITTVGTSSYTPQSTYSQVGSSSSPATSITFTMTLPSSKNITAFSAKFGGFKDTAGTIKLKVGDTEVGSGSLSGTSDVPVSNSSTASGTVLTVTVTNISKGVKCYYISCTYANTSAYTVTFDAEGGTCGTASETEGSVEAGVVLPAASPSVSMASMGWGFYGWAEDAVDDPTTTAPTIVGKAGDTYYPSRATTLHAVFAKGEYTKVTSIGTEGLTSGSKYLIVANYSGHNYILKSSSDDYSTSTHKLASALVDETSTGKYSVAAINPSWCYTISGSEDNWRIQDVINATNNYLDIAYTDWWGNAYDDDDPYRITVSAGVWSLNCHYYYNSKYNDSYLSFDETNKLFYSNSSTYPILLYKETVTPTYCSNPSTIRLVASPAAGGSVDFDDNSSAEMDFATADGYIGNITATPNDGYDFVNWVSSDEDVAIVDAADDPTTELTATESATITANFYQKRSISYILTEGGVAGVIGNPTTVTKGEKDGFSAMFTMQAHYKDMTLVSVTMGGSPMTEGSGADYEWEVDGGTAMLTIHHANIDGDIEITVSATHMEYTKYAFSCSELTLTPKLVTAGTPIFITSAASKKVRSQDSILIVGSGLTPSTSVTFPGLPSQFEVKSRLGGNFTTKADGTIDTVAYIFYTPAAGDTSDGLDKLTGITVSVGGAKPKTVNLTQDIIGRHLPADFVIAGKYNGKWYALGSYMSELTNPALCDIGVDDDNDPSIAFGRICGYELYAQGNEPYIKLAMKSQSDAPLFGEKGTKIGKSGTAIVTNTLGDGYLWMLTQINTSITDPQDAIYKIQCKNYTNTLTIKNSPNLWGQYATSGTDVDELRLIPRDDDVWFEEARIVEWGQHSIVVEFDNSSGIYEKAKAKIGETETAGFVTVSQTLTSVAELATKYNYTINFGDAIDFSEASPGDMLTLKWYTYGETWRGISNITIPKIIATDGVMKSIEGNDTPWSKWEVHVLPGVTLEANAGLFSSSDVTIDNLQIYPGATVKITSGTLDVKNLSLRNGWTRATTKKYDVARLQIKATANLTHTNAYLDWYIDNDQYYPVAVPFPVTVSNITYLNTKNTVTVGGTTGVIRLRYYDGEGRAAGNSGNWKYYGESGSLAVPAQLLPSMGYAMAAKRPGGKAFSIVRMPMTFDNAWTTGGEHGSATVDATPLRKDTVRVYAYGNAKTAENNKGWNLIGNPYMAVFHGDDEEEGIYGKLLAVTNKEDEKAEKVRYVTIPNSSFTDYTQVNFKDTLLKPSSSFLIQAKDTCRLEFSSSKIDIPSAPARYTATPTAASEQEAYIRLTGAGEKDQMGLIIGEDYTAAYETNADLAKMHGELNTLKTYMVYDSVDMAYLAINEDLAKEWIPVVARIPESGEYTYSLRTTSVVNELEGIYLIDYQTNTVTNLIENNYSFTSEAGIIEGRFSINVIAGQRETPTDIDAINAGGDLNSNKSVKFVWNDKVYIWLNGVIYDTTGKRVK